MAKDSVFDDLARGLADGSLTRGKALRLMGAAVVGGTLGSLGIGEASADPPGCKRNGKNCKRNGQCCSGNCSGESCRAQTTTTTTSTTSTTTTPVCLPNGSPCNPDDDQCCERNCHGVVCCRVTSQPCSSNSDCCPSLFCNFDPSTGTSRCGR